MIALYGIHSCQYLLLESIVVDPSHFGTDPSTDLWIRILPFPSVVDKQQKNIVYFDVFLLITLKVHLHQSLKKAKRSTGNKKVEIFFFAC